MYRAHLFRLFSFLLCLALWVSASGAKAAEKAHGEKFDPGHLILTHVVDAHDWHFATIDGHHYTLYLPVIAYRYGAGFDVFSSEHLHEHMKAESDFAADEHMEHMGYYLDENEHLMRTDKAGFVDVSITKNVLSLFISVALLFGVFFSVAGAYKKRGIGRPSGLQSLMEPIIVFIRDEIAKPNIGPKYMRFLPYLLTVFFFIWFNNLLGLLPGGANLTGNIAVTLTLAVLTFIITTFSGNKDYWKHVYNTPGVPWWLKFPIPLMPAVEFIGLFTKPVSLMIRLFANITAGHIIILSLLSLIFIFESYAVGFVSAIFVVVMTFLELLVALIQAYVFTLLTSMYFGGAVAEHDHHHDTAHSEDPGHLHAEAEHAVLAKA
jgi:F-type H+-transporting ATPase subunit a